MSSSVAMFHLTRRILFTFAQKLGMDSCFRCGKKIETVKELSIEHKQRWLDIDPAMFWDIENNIAFSHLICNCRAGGHAGAGRKWTPEERKAHSVRMKGKGKGQNNRWKNRKNESAVHI